MKDFRDYYTENEIDYMILYYGQIPENLTYNQKAIFIEKFENEICYKVEKIRSKIS